MGWLLEDPVITEALSKMVSAGWTDEEARRSLGLSLRAVRAAARKAGLRLLRYADLEMERDRLLSRGTTSEKHMRHLDDVDAQHMREAFAGGMQQADLAAFYQITVVDVVLTLRGVIYSAAKGPLDKALDVPPGCRGKVRPCGAKLKAELKALSKSCREKYLSGGAIGGVS